MTRLMDEYSVIFTCSFLFSIVRLVMGVDTMFPKQSMRYNDTLSSQGGTFELCFFSLSNSSENHYLGIRYKKISSRTVAWLANRETPLVNQNGTLKFTDQGFLVLFDGANNIVWSPNTSRTTQEPIVQLLESGNLVVKEKNESEPDKYLWQSFDYPGDTLLPGMKVGRNLETGVEWFLSSWKSNEDPTRGQYSLRVDPNGVPQLIFLKGSQLQLRMGSWNGVQFTGNRIVKENTIYSAKFVVNEEEVYYENELLSDSVLTRYVVEPSGSAQRFVWRNQEKDWELFRALILEQCDNYAFCGAYTGCNENNDPLCSCLEGFISKSSKDPYGGCIRRTTLSCDNKDGFLKHSQLKLPDTSSAWVNKSMDLQECRKFCLENCSCIAYANSDITEGGSGCLVWYHDLVDIKEFPTGGQDLYVRLAASEMARIKRSGFKKKNVVEIMVSCAIVAMLLMALGLVLCIRKKKRKKQDVMEDLDLPIFDLSTILNATNNFCSSKKLGEGGFGPVYKGELAEGKEIAVKRLSRTSGQGIEELKNEVSLIAKLQHRNLVKLFGCCIEKDEKLLIYEYMPNKSLDYFIFDQTRSKLLEWQKRIHIIVGIARGLLYLHQDSRLKIIHRDLKASNVLLDKNMNPKISDFGMARLCGEEETGESTRRVVGTYGYMSPEYATYGRFSDKSDIFSFGVLVLEIVSGKRNREFQDPKYERSLTGHAWKLCMDERTSELIDTIEGDTCDLRKVLRCIHVGLLCVQQKPEDRPNMSSVVLMLGSSDPLPRPKPPGFFTGGDIPEVESSPNKRNSRNEITITSLEAR